MKLFRIIFCFLFLAGLLAWAQPVFAQEKTIFVSVDLRPTAGVTGEAVSADVSTAKEDGARLPGVTVDIKWGDGSSNQGTSDANGSLSLKHTYAAAGTYNVTVTGAKAEYKSGDAATGVTIEVPKEDVALSAKFPRLEIQSGGTAEIEGELKYTYNGQADGKPRVFDVSVRAPKDWYAYVSPQYPKEKQIASVELKRGFAGENLVVTVFPAPWVKPDPGDYKITFDATSGDLKKSFDLNVTVTAKYLLSALPKGDRYNATAIAGKNNYFPIIIRNGGTVPVDNIAFSADTPKDWTVEFPLQRVDSLAPGFDQNMDINIKPPSKAIAGDYNISITATGKQATTDRLNIRVTVATPTIWGWVGVGIIVLIIAGLAFVFMRFSRR
ncbi:MAG: hypothetical protein HY670_11700 [Chloroflexi bacterium]|nr:hypothetical protein [Chloroflexota bacterium]